MTDVRSRKVAPSPARSIPTFYRVLLRGQLTRGRLAGLAVLAGISVLLAAVSRGATDPEGAGVDVLASYSIGLLIPLAALILATPMLGNLIEDRLLVYLWLKPVPRWHLAVAALGAVVSALAPVVVLPILVSVIVMGLPGLIAPAIVASVLGVVAYAGIYLFVGVRFSWGIWLGLLYLVLWENVMSRFGEGMARLSIRSYLVTILEWGTQREIDLANRAQLAAILVPVGVALAATALTARALQTRDVD